MVDEAAGRVFNHDYAQFGGDPTWRLASFAVTSYGLGTDNVNLNKLTSFGYDASGRLTSFTDPRGNTTRFGYDGATRRVATIARVTADTSDTDPTTTFTYPTTVGADCTDPKTVARTVVNGERTSVTDTTTYCLDSHDRVVQTVDAKGHTRSGEYTSNSNMTTLNESDVAGGPAFDYRYSNSDNLNRVTLPTGGQAFTDYGDSASPHLPTAVRDFSVGSANGPATWAYDYDSKGNLIEAHNPTQGVTFRYCYDGNGQIQRVDPPPTGTTLDNDTSAGCGTATQDNDTLLSYDTEGNLTTVNPPGPHGTLTYTYDAVSRVKTITDGRGVVATVSYDALDRPTSIVSTHPTDGSVTVSYGYDENGNLTARQDATGNTNYTYDELNRNTHEAPQQPASSTNYTYDLAGNLTSIDVTEEPAPVTYTYNNLNLVTSVTDQRGLTTTFGYNNRDLRTSTAYPNGVTQEARWDNSRRMTCIYAYTGNGPGNGPNACPAASTSLLIFFKYDYTSAGGIDTTTRYGVTRRDGATTTYTYDDLMRLTRARTVSDTGTELNDYQYTLNPRGNITRETVTGSNVPNTTTTFAYNAAAELCWIAPGTPAGDCAAPPAGATVYSYDDAGNLASTSDGMSASYNQHSQTTQITPPGGQAFSMGYGDVTQDRRTLAGDQRIAYNQLGLSSQGPNSGVPHASWFVRDPAGTLVAMVDRNDDEKDLYYLFDGLGSVAATVRNDQTVDRRYTYDPYGEQTAPDPATTDLNPWRYTSGYYDQTTGMLKLGTRYYMPNLARWTQQDPIPGNPGDPMTLNPYTYVGANPTNTTDPSGRMYTYDTGGGGVTSPGSATSGCTWYADIGWYCESVPRPTFCDCDDSGFTDVVEFVGYVGVPCVATGLVWTQSGLDASVIIGYATVWANFGLGCAVGAGGSLFP